MISIRVMTKEDLDAVLENPLDPDVKVCVGNIPTQPALTAYIDNTVLAVGGVNWFWDGVGEAWVIYSKNIATHKWAIGRATHRIFKILLNQYQWRRVQAVVRTDWKEAVRMVENFGFHREGRMRRYCPNGDDVYMYGMVK